MKRILVLIVALSLSVCALAVPSFAAPASSFASIKYTVIDMDTGSSKDYYGSYLDVSRDFGTRVQVVCRFDLPSGQTDSIVTFRFRGVYYDDTHSKGFFSPSSVSGSVYGAGIKIEQLSVNDDTPLGNSEVWYRADCSTLGSSGFTIVFDLTNDSVLAQSRLELAAYVSSLDVAVSNGWLARIWTSIKSGFASVGSWISAQTSAIGNFFSTNFNALRGWISDQTAAIVAKFDELISGGSQAGDVDNAVDKIDKDSASIGKFEGDMQGGISSGVTDLTGKVQLGGLTAAFAFVATYCNAIFAKVPVQLFGIFYMPILIGVFFLFCQHVSKVPRSAKSAGNDSTQRLNSGDRGALPPASLPPGRGG